MESLDFQYNLKWTEIKEPIVFILIFFFTFEIEILVDNHVENKIYIE